MTNRRDSSNKTAGIHKRNVLLAVFGLVIIVAGIFLLMNMQKNKQINQADALIEIGNFDGGIVIYDKILTKKYSEEIMKKRQHAIELKKAHDNYMLGVEALDADELLKAVKNFSKVPIEDKKLYEKSLDEIKRIETTIALEIQEQIDASNFDEAKEMINAYLKVEPNSSEIRDMRDAVTEAQNEMEKQLALEEEKLKKLEQAKEEERKNKEEKAFEDARKKELAEQTEEQISHTINRILWTTQAVVTDTGNLRDAPTLKGKIIASLPRGTEVYILDTQVEPSNRIWCRVELTSDGEYYNGWISYNTMNYSLN